MISHTQKLENNIFEAFSFGSMFNISFDLFESIHLIVRSILEIFDISL